MKKPFKQIIILIISGALLIAMPIEILGLIHNEKTFRSEAESKMQYAIKGSSIELNSIFDNMESFVTLLQSTAAVMFDQINYIDNRQEFMAAKKEISTILAQTLRNTKQISGLYITFNPEKYPNRQEVWYAYRNGRVTLIDAAHIARTWLVRGNPNVDYYYDSIKYGKYWGGLDYERSLDEYMATHTKPVYDSNKDLIGIVGSDMLMTDVTDILSTMKIYDNSQVVLFSSDLSLYACSDPITEASSYFRPLASKISCSNSNSGYTWYTASDHKRHIAAFTTLDNGWILAATQPRETVLTPSSNTKNVLILTMCLTIAVIIILTAVLIRKFYNPIIHSAEQNEIILINQSRQAKLGEMIGNIAHQCKQPLNSLNIDIANMSDDYYADELTPYQFNEYITKMRENVTIMSATITDFADFLKPIRNREHFAIQQSIEKALTIINESFKINQIQVTNKVDPDITICSYQNELTQCIFNILENARDAMVSCELSRSQRQICITSEQKIEKDTKSIKVHIFNYGSNIPADIGKRIFEPYFSTKAQTGGTGLGLYLTKKILQEHFNGTIYYNNDKGGVTFTVELLELKEVF